MKGKILLVLSLVLSLSLYWAYVPLALREYELYKIEMREWWIREFGETEWIEYDFFYQRRPGQFVIIFGVAVLAQFVAVTAYLIVGGVSWIRTKKVTGKSRRQPNRRILELLPSSSRPR